MIVSTWTQFRWLWSVRGAGSPTCTFTPPHDITRAAGTWAGDGLLPGQDIDFALTASNNRRYTYTGIPGPAYITVAETVVAEGPVACTFSSAQHDHDGLETWPLALVRSGGIGAITGTPTPYAFAPFFPTINAIATDAVPGVDEYDWYLSQRTDDPTKQLLTIIPYPATLGLPGQTYSGTIYLAHSPLAALSEVILTGLADTTPEKIPVLFKYAHLYCRRRSDGAIQWIDLLRAMTASI